MELTQKQKVIYICHPYTGNEEFNRQDARKIALKLKMQYPDSCIINPLDLFYWTTGKLTYNEIIKMCLTILLRCDTIYLCKRWEKSHGCKIEFEQAILEKMEVMKE